MAGKASNDDDFVAEINVTPLVDVVLVLLVIFMITAPFIYQSAIKVQLPKAVSGDESKKSALEFSVSKAGKVFWGTDELEWDVLEVRLKELADKNINETAVISADKEASHGNVIRLMDLLRQVGLTRFALNVERK